MQYLIPLSELNRLEILPDDYVVIGGTFDPIHEGHISLVRAVLPFFRRVIIAPTTQNPWKNAKLISANIRREMINLVLSAENFQIAHSSNDNGICICEYNYEFSFELVKHLRGNLIGNIYWVVGEDSKDTVQNWRSWDSLNVPVIYAPIVIERHSTQIRQNTTMLHPALVDFCTTRALYTTSK